MHAGRALAPLHTSPRPPAATAPPRAASCAPLPPPKPPSSPAHNSNACPSPAPSSTHRQQVAVQVLGHAHRPRALVPLHPQPAQRLRDGAHEGAALTPRARLLRRFVAPLQVKPSQAKQPQRLRYNSRRRQAKQPSRAAHLVHHVGPAQAFVHVVVRGARANLHLSAACAREAQRLPRGAPAPQPAAALPASQRPPLLPRAPPQQPGNAKAPTLSVPFLSTSMARKEKMGVTSCGVAGGARGTPRRPHEPCGGQPGTRPAHNSSPSPTQAPKHPDHTPNPPTPFSQPL